MRRAAPSASLSLSLSRGGQRRAATREREKKKNLRFCSSATLTFLFSSSPASRIAPRRSSIRCLSLTTARGHDEPRHLAPRRFDLGVGLLPCCGGVELPSEERTSVAATNEQKNDQTTAASALQLQKQRQRQRQRPFFFLLFFFFLSSPRPLRGRLGPKTRLVQALFHRRHGPLRRRRRRARRRKVARAGGGRRRGRLVVGVPGRVPGRVP